MTSSLTPQTHREGDGWAAFVGPTTITIFIEDGNDEAELAALDDLREWSNITDWVMVNSGWTNLGVSFFEYEWEPAEQSLPAVP